MPSFDWLSDALTASAEDKSRHIPYLIYDKESINKENNATAQEILNHHQVRQIAENLSSDKPEHTDTSLILTAALEIRPTDIQKDVRQFMDSEVIGGYYVDITPTNAPFRVRLYRRAEENRQPHLEITTTTDCTSPERGTVTKTEFFNLDGQKISDHYHIQFDKNFIDRDDATDQLSSDFYIHIISELSSTLSDRKHPKGIMVEVGFTSDINGEMPMVVLMSENDNPLVLHTQPKQVSTSVTNHPELMNKYLEIATTYTNQILNETIKINPVQ